MNKISLCNIFIEGKEADVSWITIKSPKTEQTINKIIKTFFVFANFFSV